MKDAWIIAHNVVLGGTVHAKGARVSVDPTHKYVKALLADKYITLTKPKYQAKLDNKPLIQHNSLSKKNNEAKNGKRRNSKSRSVRHASEAVPEGLPGAESSD